MAGPARPERSTSARPSRQLSRFYRSINSDMVFGTHSQGAGHELFLAADVRVAASNTVFAQPEVTRGHFPAGGAPITFVREAGWANAMRYMLTGDEWDAEEAYRMGLIQYVTPPGKQLDRSRSHARYPPQLRSAFERQSPRHIARSVKVRKLRSRRCSLNLLDWRRATTTKNTSVRSGKNGLPPFMVTD